MVSFYPEDINHNTYTTLSSEQQSRYTRYVYYSNVDVSNTGTSYYTNVWVDEYSNVVNQGDYTEIPLYSLAIPIDYPEPTLPQEDIDWLNKDVAWRTMRTERTKELDASDWTQSPDNSLTTEKKAEWTAYRTLLRDLPPTYTDDTILNWELPTKPV